jgi:hypothetical protein
MRSGLPALVLAASGCLHPAAGVGRDMPASLLGQTGSADHDGPRARPLRLPHRPVLANDIGPVGRGLSGALATIGLATAVGGAQIFADGLTLSAGVVLGLGHLLARAPDAVVHHVRAACARTSPAGLPFELAASPNGDQAVLTITASPLILCCIGHLAVRIDGEPVTDVGEIVANLDLHVDGDILGGELRATTRVPAARLGAVRSVDGHLCGEPFDIDRARLQSLTRLLP